MMQQTASDPHIRAMVYKEYHAAREHYPALSVVPAFRVRITSNTNRYGSWQPGNRTLSVSRMLMGDDLLDTVRHELAHHVCCVLGLYTFPRSSFLFDAHDSAWQDVARTLGAKPCARNKQLNLEAAKYVIGCAQGCKIAKNRASRQTRQPELYRCRKHSETLFRIK